MRQCASEEIYSACSQLVHQPRPLQSRENLGKRRNVIGDSPNTITYEEILRTSNKRNNSK